MRELFHSLAPYFRPYRKGMIAGVLLVVVANVFSVATPYLIKLAIDALSVAQETGSIRQVVFFGVAIVVATLLGGAARYGMRELLNGISRRIEADLRNNFFQHLLTLDPGFYGEVRTGDIMARATNDTLAVRMAAGPAIMYAVNTAVGFVFAASMMIWISPRLTLIAMVPLAVLPPLVLRIGKSIHRRFEEIQEQFSTVSTMIQENLTGVRIVRAYGQEGSQAQDFQEMNEEYLERNMALARVQSLFHPLLSFIAGLGAVAVLWLGGLEVVAGRMTVGDFVAFGFYLNLLIWPMIALGWVVNLFQRGAASMKRINGILEREPAVTSPPEPVRPEQMAGKVEFRNVSFRYPGTEREVLQDVSFTAEPGKTVAVVGPTGSGKSTLVSLIPRLYDPTGGQVLLDDRPLPDYRPRDVRQAVGMVPQDAFLFSDTIGMNIALGLSDAETLPGGSVDEAGSLEMPEEPAERVPDQVVRASRIAQLHESVQDFPRQYGTMLGERGINLSGGQKQRATLARALARDPVILVLDDALSAVDTHTEAQILADLKETMRGRTSFIISHRVSAVMDADEILVLEDGRIVERGTHEDLLKLGGTYATLLRRQLLEEEVESEGVAAD